MSHIRQTIWLLLVMVTLATSGWYFARNDNSPVFEDARLATARDVVMHDLLAKRYDEQGHIMHSLQTPELQHIPRDNMHYFKTPVIDTRMNDGNMWNIVAGQAVAYNGAQKIILTDNVIAKTTNENGANRVFTTEEITWLTAEKRAITNKRTSFREAG